MNEPHETIQTKMNKLSKYVRAQYRFAFSKDYLIYCVSHDFERQPFVRLKSKDVKIEGAVGIISLVSIAFLNGSQEF